jgi:hypothetical protein
MNALTTSFMAFGVILVGVIAGITLPRVLPARYLSNETKDIVRLGAGLIATIAALVLGLLIAAANGSFQTQRGLIQRIAADIILIDQLLAQYGSEATPAREELRKGIGPLVDRIWRGDAWLTAYQVPLEPTRYGQDIAALIVQLAPNNDAQKIFKDRTIQIISDLAQTRFLLFEHAGGSLPPPFLIVLVFWLALIFASFGMFGGSNPISIAALVVCAAAASGALFLILDLSEPFTGLMHIPSEPLRHTLAPL